MKSFCTDASVNTKHHGNFWRKMKPSLPSTAKSRSQIVLLEDEQLIIDRLLVAEAFNDYFCELAKCDGNRMDMEDSTRYPSIMSNGEKTKIGQSFNFHTVNCGYVMEILDKLNPRKAVRASKMDHTV